MAGCAAGGWLIALLAATPTPARTPVATPAPAPSMELLLHLAEFGDAEDRYIDPAELEELGPAVDSDAQVKARREEPAEEAEDEAP